MKFVISDSPTWPAHSKPSMDKKSTPSLIADRACRMVVHLCRMMMLARLSWAITGPGLLPAVSTIVIPDSIIACA